jgi:hypothetical protein
MSAGNTMPVATEGNSRFIQFKFELKRGFAENEYVVGERLVALMAEGHKIKMRGYKPRSKK